MTMADIIKDWSGYRRALRTEDRDAFDAMMVKAQMHASAASYQVSSDPVETVFLSILLEREKTIRRLEACKGGSSMSTRTTTGT
jgi:hypothetical protein